VKHYRAEVDAEQDTFLEGEQEEKGTAKQQYQRKIVRSRGAAVGILSDCSATGEVPISLKQWERRVSLWSF
jgi:hypothetical protein